MKAKSGSAVKMDSRKLDREWDQDGYVGCRVADRSDVQEAARLLNRRYPGRRIIIHGPAGELLRAPAQ